MYDMLRGKRYPYSGCGTLAVLATWLCCAPLLAAGSQRDAATNDAAVLLEGVSLLSSESAASVRADGSVDAARAGATDGSFRISAFTRIIAATSADAEGLLQACVWFDGRTQSVSCAELPSVESWEKSGDTSFETVGRRVNLTAGFHSVNFAVSASSSALASAVHHFVIGVSGDVALVNGSSEWCRVAGALGGVCGGALPQANPTGDTWFYRNGPFPTSHTAAVQGESYLMVLSSASVVRDKWPEVLSLVGASGLCVRHAQLLRWYDSAQADSVVRRFFGFPQHIRSEIGFHTGKFGVKRPFLVLVLYDAAPVYVQRALHGRVGETSWVSGRPADLMATIRQDALCDAATISLTGLDGARDIALLFGMHKAREMVDGLARCGSPANGRACMDAQQLRAVADEGDDEAALATPLGDTIWNSLDEALRFLHLATRFVIISDDSIVDADTSVVLVTDNPRAVLLALNARALSGRASVPALAISVAVNGPNGIQHVQVRLLSSRGVFPKVPEASRAIDEVLRLAPVPVGGCSSPRSVSVAGLPNVLVDAVMRVATCAPTSTASPVRGVILAAAYSMTWSALAPFVVSARRSCYTGDIILFMHDDLDHVTRERFEAYGVTAVSVTAEYPFFVNAERDVPGWFERASLIESLRPDIGIINSRFMLSDEWLVSNAAVRGYTHVLLSDSADVIFQQHPFEWHDALGYDISDDALYAFEEAQLMEDPGASGELIPATLSSERNNWEWFLGQYSADVRKSLQHAPVICSGTTVGSLPRIRAYLSRMRDEIAAKQNRLPLFDQGPHNVLLRLEAQSEEWDARAIWGPANVTRIVPNGDGAVRTVGIEGYRAKPSADDDVVPLDAFFRVLANTGRISPIVHQYNRLLEVTEMVARDARRADRLLPNGTLWSDLEDREAWW